MHLSESKIIISSVGKVRQLWKHVSLLSMFWLEMTRSSFVMVQLLVKTEMREIKTLGGNIFADPPRESRSTLVL